MITRHRIAAATAVLALVLPLSVGTAGSAFAATPGPAAVAQPTVTPPALPRPTGPHAVGRSVLDLVDTQRTDPWVPSAGPRQLMVSVYYPARPGTGTPAPYMTTAEAQALLDGKTSPGAYPGGPIAATTTWARTDARPAPGRFPLVLLSPGMGFTRATLSGLAEDLASRGYVVAAVDHTYETFGTTFPDGRTLGCQVCAAPPVGPAAFMQSRATDLSFVIDQLTDPHSPWPYAHLIDRQHIGVAGHSVGGDAAAITMAADPRVRAGVNMDGTFFDPMPVDGLNGRPFLMLGEQSSSRDTSWQDAWNRLDGWKRWLTVAGSEHGSFTDLPMLAAAAGIHLPGDDLTWQREEQLTHAYVGAFFDLQLKGIPQPLLDGPSADYPEVAFNS